MKKDRKVNAMRTYFRSLADVLASPLAQTARDFRANGTGQDRVLKSTRLEDTVYSELRVDDADLDMVEASCRQKLSTFPALSRDIYQSFYSLNVRKNGAGTLSEKAKCFNLPILDEVMQSDDYPALKAACEGRQIPAYEAAGEFIRQVAGNLDGLLEKAGGEKKPLDTLERLTQKRDQSLEKLQEVLERAERSEKDPEMEKLVVAAANRAQSQCNQADAVGRMVQDSIMQNREEISVQISQATHAAAQRADEANSALMAWGSGPDSSDPQQFAADMDLVSRVRQSKTLLEIGRYLGRLKELLAGKRKNGYTYGRGEKYTLELGGDINRALSSEFALLALPATAPLFLKKLQRKSLKQYQRREPVCKGSGDIICMLDESASAADQAPWCKAVALALLDIAMQEQRRFAMIHFAGIDHYQTDLFLPGQYSREDVLRAAEVFLNGNTDYATPLREALRLMDNEGFEQADMVFVTDGECMLPIGFQEEFAKKRAEKGFHVTGILLDQDTDAFSFSLEPFCTEIYRTSELAQEQIAERLLSKRVG